ncbi:ABC transporter, ATP-binding protein [Salipiger mucosus DSM 16094]|uniref:ABC transporter, ATP-binding protein n=2 Tax=Salipiger mucosus TaxID=263378 RepID=S9RQM7_9RHOB|nr:ABC transporter, ATP-binding protein [Salipiger mucosus DSM 16094]
MVRINDTATVLDSYPVQLSGGMRQRVLLALAMSGNPALLIADEPTTALDVTVQKRSVELMQDLVEREGLSGLYITHDLGVARWLCRRSHVMYRGRVVEEGPTGAILDAPRDPYTRGLVAAVPRVDEAVAVRTLPAPPPSGRPQIRVMDLRKRFEATEAVKGVSFEVRRGETFAIVGESGSGKSTIAQMLTGLMLPTEGEIRFDGEVMNIVGPRDRLRYRDLIQMVFQDPASSLNPRQTLETIVGLPLRLHGMTDAAKRRERVVELLDKVSLPADFLHRRPVSLSGGQKQRVSIARALAVSPKVLVLDEPTSALDVSVQARILKLLKDLREKEDLTFVVISHDLGVIRTLADRVAVMYHGEFLEVGGVNDIFEAPRTDYTRQLIAAVPAL